MKSGRRARPGSGLDPLGALTLGPVPLVVERVEPPRDPGAGAVEQRAVVPLDHVDARAHDARELEHGHTGGERVTRERRAQVIDPRRPCDAARLDRGRPLALANVVKREQPAAWRGEQPRRIEPRRELVERCECAPTQRNLPASAAGLAEFHNLGAACSSAASAPTGRTLRTMRTYLATRWTAKMAASCSAISRRPCISLPSNPTTIASSRK